MDEGIARRGFLGGVAATAGALTPGAPAAAADAPRSALAEGPGLTARNTFAEVEQARPALAIVCVASIEQHGPIIPVGTDFLNASALMRALAKRLRAYVPPVMPIGTAREHIQFAGSLTIQPSTLNDYFRDVVISLYGQGFRYVAFVAGHGGLSVLNGTIEELNRDFPDRACVWVTPSRLEGVMESKKTQVHVHEGEVSNSLHNIPDDVDMKNAAEFVPPVGRELFDFAYTRDLSSSGVYGSPQLASKEKGRRLFEHNVESLTQAILRVFPEIDRLKGKRP